MDKLISIIIAADSATAADLSIPLSSLNNQLGIDFRQVEVILIDNGRYQLDDLEPLRLFNHLKFRYIKPARIWSWPAALQQGLMIATGQFVMFMGPNMQLNQIDVLQRFFTVARAHPEAQLLAGTLLTQQMAPTREVTYQVDETTRLLRGRWFNRALLMQAQIAFEPFGDYTEELVARLAEAAATGHIQPVDVIACAQFLGRTVSEAVLAPVARAVTPEWVRMMDRYFTQLKAIAPATYAKALAQSIIRFYTQLAQAKPTDRDAMLALMANLVAHHGARWDEIQVHIDEARLADQAPRAPWNSEPARFDAYLARIAGH
ncbi:glycosyltransferase family A protein [Lacticaseibacillus absianus]|uniref:glycosyltransferase family A protein n=1 Tax=Lacticaseibacillus absianus TaxID=2729623 RepID=UPI0015CDE61A|nr:glycosyltransferase family A protein [Lacticaseibacillus absianus]